MSNNKNIVDGKLVYKQFIVLDDGSELQVRYNQDASLYAGTDTTLYQYKAFVGSGDDKKEVTRYAVSVNDAIRAKKTTQKEQVNNMLASGMTAQEIVALIAGK